MDKDEIQRTTVKRGNREIRAPSVKYAQLNVRISASTIAKLKKLAKASGKSQAWIVENAINQSLEFND